MATVEKFEEIQACQMARELAKYVFILTNKDEFKREFSLKDQIKRSSGSAMDNIAEGFDRSSPKDFRRFLYIAKGSASEVKSQLYRALDQKYISKEEFDCCFKLALETGKLIGGFIKYLDEIIKESDN